jgi:membrane protein implicated in regulation of membrane protease activity
MDLYDIFFNICLGLFIGGIIMSIISFILSEIPTHDNVDHIDHVDHVDNFDHIDHIDHIDHVDHLDHVDHPDHVDHLDNFDHVDHIDHIDHPDHVDHVDHPDNLDHVDSNIQETITPAPFMLLLSSGLLVFGISGIASYYVLSGNFRLFMLIIAPIVTILITKLISKVWLKIAKSVHYTISSTQNLLGKSGEVVLTVDEHGGVIKIPSDNPMKTEKLHVMPYTAGNVYEDGEKVYIVGVTNKFLLVDKNFKVNHKKN